MEMRTEKGRYQMKKISDCSDKKGDSGSREQKEDELILLIKEEEIKMMAKDKPMILLRYIGKCQQKLAVIKRRAEEIE
eukprot:3738853-Ditylum_brightwellii.AAC.1